MMLQICNGNFLFTNKTYKTTHRTPLYTNLVIPEEGIDFCIGKILPTSMFLSPKVLICEIEERQPAENPDGSSSVLIATTGQDLMDDFSYVLSFYFGGLCTTSYSFAKQLLNSEKITGNTPRNFIHQFFDERIVITNSQAFEFQSFFSKLVNSPREFYEKAIQAIRRYVTAAIRISDDLDAAYTLFVASIESLAQDANDSEVSWNDVDPRKRKGLDVILNNLDKQTADSIRSEIISHEHLALSRKFLTTAMNSLNGNFYNPEGKNYKIAGKNQLKIAIKNAYNLRSKYVHILKPLPSEISNPYNLNYCINVDGKPNLTFNGLSAVNKEVIIKYVTEMPHCNKESLDTMKFMPGIAYTQMSEIYWMHDVKFLRKENYLLLFEAVIARIENAIFTLKPEIPDMKLMVNEIGEQLSHENNKDNILILMATLILLAHFYGFTLDKKYEKTIKKHENIYNSKGIVMLLVNTLCLQKLDNITEYHLSFEDYVEKKYQKGRIKLSEFFESLVCANLINHFIESDNIDTAESLLEYIELNTPNSPIKTKDRLRNKNNKFDIFNYINTSKKPII
ncbi:TPA: hypothetical protein L9L95_004850 [Klebsiella pneumoniae]|nr:hypothetical protein [Klebsiella pneumoniae]